jgi:hypothetical protein
MPKRFRLSRKEAGEMTKEKAGLAMFWIGIGWMIVWLILGTTSIAPLMRSLTTEEINQTIWAFGGPLSFLYGISIPLGAIVAGIGVLLYAGAKGSTVWKVAIGLFVVLAVAFVAMGLNFYSAPVFGIGGILILLSFIGILWLLAQERMVLKGSSTTAVDLKLVGYVFMLMAAWFI